MVNWKSQLPSKAAFRDIVESAPDGILVINENGCIEYANATVEHLFGYNQDDLLGRSVETLIPRELREIHLQHRKDYRANPQTRPMGERQVIVARHKEGASFPVEIGLSPLNTDSGLRVVCSVRDATYRQQVKQALRAERDRVQKYLDIAGVILVVINADQTVQLINKKGCELLGRSEEGIVGRNWFDTFIPERERERTRAGFSMIMNNELDPVGYFENYIVCQDGVERLIAWQNTILTNEAGDIIGTLSSGEDITDRRKAETALQKSESFNKGILQSLDEHIAVINAQGQIIRTNESWDRFAYENKALRDTNYQGENYLAVCEKAAQQGNEIAEKTLLGIKGVIKGVLSSFTLEYPCDSPTEKRWFLMRAIPMADESGMVIVVHTNITDLKQAQSQVQKQKRFLRQVIDTNPSLVFAKDYDGRFTLANQAVAEIYGTTTDDLIGKTDSDFNVDDDEVTQFLEADRLVISTAQPEFIPQEKLTSATGETRWFQTIKVPLETDSGDVQVLGVATDITERREFERQLKQSKEELEAAYEKTLEGWIKALDLRDKETEGHTLRVTKMTVRLAQALGMRGEALEHVRRGALLHDIGKMAIPDAILHKPGSLDEDEWEIMRKHPSYAFEWLSPISFLKPALDIPYCHHEKWDGTGYPHGMKGDEIPLAARIFAVVDVWDALSSDRPYRKAWPKEKVCQHIQQEVGTHFDPEIVELFLNIHLDDR